MPGTTNVGNNIKELYRMKAHPSESSRPSQAGGRSRAQIIAIAESQARKAGGHEHAHMHKGFHSNHGDK